MVGSAHLRKSAYTARASGQDPDTTRGQDPDTTQTELNYVAYVCIKRYVED